MLEDVPFPYDGANIAIDYLVLPLSLEDYYDAFWSDYAPYLAPASIRDPEDILIQLTKWIPPTEGFEVVDNRTVMAERHLERDLKFHSAFTPDYCRNFARYSMLEKNETHLTWKVTAYGFDDCAGGTSFENWMMWEIMTPDPRSRQVVHRLTYWINWLDRPWYGSTIEGILEDGFEKYNYELNNFFKSSATNYLIGEPYENATVGLDGVETWVRPEENPEEDPEVDLEEDLDEDLDDT